MRVEVLRGADLETSPLWHWLGHNCTPRVEDLTPRQPLHYHFHTSYPTDSRTRETAEPSAALS